MDVSRVKEITKKSQSKSRKKTRQVQVREIHLGFPAQGERKNSTSNPSKSIKKILPGVKRRNEPSKSPVSNSKAIKIVNRPNLDNSFRPIPT